MNECNELMPLFRLKCNQDQTDIAKNIYYASLSDTKIKITIDIFIDSCMRGNLQTATWIFELLENTHVTIKQFNDMCLSPISNISTVKYVAQKYPEQFKLCCSFYYTQLFVMYLHESITNIQWLYDSRPSDNDLFFIAEQAFRLPECSSETCDFLVQKTFGETGNIADYNILFEHACDCGDVDKAALIVNKQRLPISKLEQLFCIACLNNDLGILRLIYTFTDICDSIVIKGFNYACFSGNLSCAKYLYETSLIINIRHNNDYLLRLLVQESVHIIALWISTLCDSYSGSMVMHDTSSPTFAYRIDGVIVTEEEIDENDINSITTDNDTEQTELSQCIICTEEKSSDAVLQCNHSFCFDCISTWYKSHKTCPICREPIIKCNVIVKKK